ncbi:MAG: MFS transporter, partial [Acidobacteriota bacterium]
GSRPPLIVGPSVTAAGFLTLGMSGADPSYWTGFLPGLILVAAGMTLSVAPLTATVFNSVPDEKSGTASGVNNAAARVGGLLAVAALGLAFGRSDPASIGGAGVANAYRLVMFLAAVLAGSSAVTAAVMISPQRLDPPLT